MTSVHGPTSCSCGPVTINGAIARSSGADSFGPLPIDDETLDAALLLLVLHHVPDPGAALREAARALKPGGRLLISDMLPHDREEYRHQMGHIWLGLSEDQMRKMMASAGMTDLRIVPLPADPDARGPALFVAAATK